MAVIPASQGAMIEGDSGPQLLALIEAEQARLRGLLAGADQPRLAQRPPKGDWSVVENIRHLLFAEQLHFLRLLPQPTSWSPLGLTTGSMRNFPHLREVGTTPSADVEEVLHAWETVHAQARPFLQADTVKTQKALRRNLRHLRAHIAVIERLLRARHTEESRG